MKLKDFTKGQTAYLVSSSKNVRMKEGKEECVVKSVGRKYVTIIWKSLELKFSEWEDRTYLIEKKYTGWVRYLFSTKKAAEEFLETEKLRLWLRNAVDFSHMERYTLQQLREVRKILEDTEES